MSALLFVPFCPIERLVRLISIGQWCRSCSASTIFCIKSVDGHNRLFRGVHGSSLLIKAVVRIIILNKVLTLIFCIGAVRVLAHAFLVLMMCRYACVVEFTAAANAGQARRESPAHLT